MTAVITHLESGTDIAGFRIESFLAEGGMGTVYLATQLALDREVALKVLSQERRDDPEFRERFVRESKLAASLKHPNVLPVFDAGTADDHLYLAMQYVEGGDLRHMIRQQGRLPALIALQIAQQMAGALDAAHRAGLVHRDVKPANVLLADGDHAYLADFGLARSENTRGVTQTGVVMGTPDYAAPEQLHGVVTVDGRADIYSLGCVLYHCLAGQPPYVRESEVGVMTAHLHDPVPQLSQIRPDLPPTVGAIVGKAMEKDRANRYSTASELAVALGGVLADLSGIETYTKLPLRESDTRPIAQAPPATSGRSRTVLDRVDAQTPAPLAAEGIRRRFTLGRLRPSRRATMVVLGLAVAAITGTAVALAGDHSHAPPPLTAKQLLEKRLRVTSGAVSDHRSRHGFDRAVKVRFTASGPVTQVDWMATDRSGKPRSGHLKTTHSPAFISHLRNGTLYAISLKACKRNVCGRWLRLTPRVSPFGVPNKPSVDAALAPNGKVKFSWQPPSRSSGRSLAAYHITIATNGITALTLTPKVRGKHPQSKTLSASCSVTYVITAYVTDSKHQKSEPAQAHVSTSTCLTQPTQHTFTQPWQPLP
jgi:serine/threonine-protein kinase